jgi:hypothetical protein
MPFKIRRGARPNTIGLSDSDAFAVDVRPSHVEMRQNLSMFSTNRRGLEAYLERHYDELMALVDERRRPEYANEWEEI